MEQQKNPLISDLAGLSQPITKLIEVVASGLGRAYEPYHIKRIAKAKAKEIELISESVTKNLSLPVEYLNGEISLSTANTEDLIRRTSERLLFQEIQKQQNIENVLVHTENELLQVESVSDAAVDNDWINRFINSVEDISNQDMQKLWGKLLAGEIQHPKSFSLRTLEVMKNLSSFEAELFKKLCNYIILEDRFGFVFNLPNIKETIFSSYTDWLILEEAKLIIRDSSLNLTVELGAFEEEIITFGNLAVVIKNLTSIPIKEEYPCINLTSAGFQLMNIVEYTRNQESILPAVLELKNNYVTSRVSIKVHSIIEQTEGNIVYDNTIDLL